MTPEERAKKIGYTYSNNPQCERDIATAIREARAEALEEAAREAGNPGIVSPKQAELLRTRILALKNRPE